MRNGGITGTRRAMARVESADPPGGIFGEQRWAGRAPDWNLPAQEPRWSSKAD